MQGPWDKICHFVIFTKTTEAQRGVYGETHPNLQGLLWNHCYSDSILSSKYLLSRLQPGTAPGLRATPALLDPAFSQTISLICWFQITLQVGGEGMNWEFGISRCKLLCIEWINNKVLLYSTGNYIQYPVINDNGKEYEKECIYMYNWITLLYSRN